MADNTIIRIPAAKYGINEIVYLKESAANGYLEALKVGAVQYDSSIGRTMYFFTFKKGAVKTQTAGDANDLRRENTIAVVEEELLTRCEALDIKIAFLVSELAKANAMKSDCTPAGNVTGTDVTSG